MQPAQNSRDFPLAAAAYELEAPFRANGYTGDVLNPSFMLLPGSIPLILSAPHAVKHYRDQRQKTEDIRTGALTRQLAQLSGSYAIINARTSLEDDPNWHPAGPYKQRLAQLVRASGARLLLDIHGISNEPGRDVIIGTAHGANLCGKSWLAELLLHTLQEHGLASACLDEAGFNAARAHTISSYIARDFHIPAIQLEIARKFRNNRDQPANYEMLLRALLSAIDRLTTALR